ncbi:UPF0145 protein [Ceratocystis fimbriata CBS 114723]|uniref:UPF0145 protein n=1 Tax=Ceratocystis fimbriata CBS 114723 TaxID=1035309 RepID=A0A2C5X233_9PEZI|nr:UPF0145 protein [Ceratocystis fimbriata CBS 114723]
MFYQNRRIDNEFETLVGLDTYSPTKDKKSLLHNRSLFLSRNHSSSRLSHGGCPVAHAPGTVYGLTVRSCSMSTRMEMAFKSMIGGELCWSTSMIDSVVPCVKEAKDRSANAIICPRVGTSDIGGFAEVCAL